MGNNLFVIIDVSALAALLIFLVFFLFKNKKNLGKEGVLYLYRTSWGINLINKIGGKYKKTLRVMSYLSIFIGGILMMSILYLLGSQTYQYLTNPQIAEIIKAPPIAPLIPYFPQLFGLSDFFPPFYAIYFIISILIVATVHEFSHGIFAKRWGVKIKSTGFAFLKFFPVFFGAFVEQEDKQMRKKRKVEQMSILSAGVFANILTAIIFLIVLAIFFSIAFSPSGVAFNDYLYTVLPVAGITSVNNISLTNPAAEDIIPLLKNDSFNEIKVGNETYLGVKGFSGNKDTVALYNDAPAIKLKLDAIILEINGVKITGTESFRNELLKYSPGDKITITTMGEEVRESEITLGKNPADENAPFLGVMMIADSESKGLLNQISHLLFFNHSNIYYESKIGAAGEFFYYLIWWIFLINILVGLFNMLPLGILDGGRFFYLAVVALTKSDNIAKKIHQFFAYLIFLIFLLLMVRWAFSLF